MTTSPEPDRKTAILDAAETAFADAGFEGASLRRIVREAGVNLATVYYYFESKEGLMLAVMDRRFRPLREEQLSGLGALEQAAAGRPLAVEAILETLLLPTLRLVGTGSVRQEAVKRLIGRVVTEPNPQIQQLLVRPHSVMRAAFFKALHRSLPDLPMPDLVWRMEFIWGALGFVLCNPAKIEMVTAGVCNPADTETVFQQMIRFFGAGLKAPPVSAVSEFGGRYGGPRLCEPQHQRIAEVAAGRRPARRANQDTTPVSRTRPARRRAATARKPGRT